jgi:sugar phosphate isomerase/epimerase
MLPTNRLALHTWTLDTTPLATVVRVAKEAGWDAIELRRIDFSRAREGGLSAEEVLALVRRSGLPVACVGVQLGWLFAESGERAALLRAFEESCRWAAALGCGTIMSPVDPGRGDPERAVASVREVGEIAAHRGVRLALEFNAVAQQFNTLAAVRALLQQADHPRCGLLLDTYHLGRSGAALDAVRTLAPEEIVYVQYSDVPPQHAQPGVTTDRLPPGAGVFPFREFFQILRAKGYGGFLSYEAPNPEAWTRDPLAAAREALDATRRLLGRPNQRGGE